MAGQDFWPPPFSFHVSDGFPQLSVFCACLIYFTSYPIIFVLHPAFLVVLYLFQHFLGTSHLSIVAQIHGLLSQLANQPGIGWNSCNDLLLLQDVDDAVESRMPPLVTAQEITQLLSLLAAPDQTLSQLTQRFKQSWTLVNSGRLRALFAILLLLQEGALRQPVQRLAALHLLHDLTREHHPRGNPFAPFLIQAVLDSIRSYPERLFIQSLLVEGKSPEGTVAEVARGVFIQQTPVPLLGADELWCILHSREAGRAPNAALSETASAPGNKQTDAVQKVLTGVAREGVPPLFIRPRPPLMSFQPGEVRWLHPQLPQVLRWDSSMGQDPTPLTELQQLLKQALKRPLLPQQQQQVLSELEADRKLVMFLNLTPASLPHLVEHNPAIAIEVLLRLIQVGHGGEFLPAVVNMEMSLHSMEVVNRLSTAVDLPTAFVHMYISNCIRSCQVAQEDKYAQTRRVRLVCVFLQSLIKNHIINVQDIFYEMQAFCIEFSRVREAAVLFRLLKTLENGEKSNGEVLADAASEL